MASANGVVEAEPLGCIGCVRARRHESVDDVATDRALEHGREARARRLALEMLGSGGGAGEQREHLVGGHHVGTLEAPDTGEVLVEVVGDREGSGEVTDGNRRDPPSAGPRTIGGT